jgi:DNA-binding NarL/FixJ family response regulator
VAENTALALIVGCGGPLRDGIEALLASVHNVEVIGKVDRVSRALRTVAECPVDLILIDAALPGRQASRLIRLSLRRRPNLRLIVVANDPEQARQATTFGVSAVVLTGLPPDQFVRMVERVLSQG